MKKRSNKFSGISLTYETVFTYYRNPNCDFDHFVFQQMIADNCNSEGSNFSLVAYAVDIIHNKVLNEGKPLPSDMYGSGVPGKKPGIQFANMKLDIKALDDLYKSAKSPLLVYPPKPITYYKDTYYVQYVAETDDGKEILVNKRIDPSPPA